MKKVSKNNFNREELEYWFARYICWVCGKNHSDAIHHIVGRGAVRKGPESSMLNVAPVGNYDCHINKHAWLMRKEQQAVLLHKTLHYLLKQNFVLGEKDKKFIEKYKELYSEKDLQLCNL